jgi:CheY-like chemotaxis protein
MKPTLLVVEDEFLLRMDLVDLAQAAGFETVEAGSAAEALAILERALMSGSFSLIFVCRGTWTASVWRISSGIVGPLRS